jgi:hypothetical protein
VDEHDALLVLREWPDGSVTAYTMSKGDLESQPGGEHSGQ